MAHKSAAEMCGEQIRCDLNTDVVSHRPVLCARDTHKWFIWPEKNKAKQTHTPKYVDWSNTLYYLSASVSFVQICLHRKRNEKKAAQSWNRFLFFISFLSLLHSVLFAYRVAAVKIEIKRTDWTHTYSDKWIVCLLGGCRIHDLFDFNVFSLNLAKIALFVRFTWVRFANGQHSTTAIHVPSCSCGG